jgi:hypothetical protein
MLLDDKRLESSSVVANSLMNRQRGCLGGNSYQKELSFNPLEFFSARLSQQQTVCWLDLCCGSAKALIEASRFFHTESLTSRVQITGVDLVSMFDPYPAEFLFCNCRQQKSIIGSLIHALTSLPVYMEFIMLGTNSSCYRVPVAG